MKNRRKIIACFSLLFLLLTILVKLNLTNNIDTLLSSTISKNTNKGCTSFFKIITIFGGFKFIVFFTILTLLISFIFNKQKYGILACRVVVISTIVNNILKYINKTKYITVSLREWL